MKRDDLAPRLGRFKSYKTAARYFRWPSPDRFNIAAAVVRRHEARTALIEVRKSGENTYTFGALDFFSDKFANALHRAGLKREDAIAVMLPQSAALAIAHLGALKLGCAVAPIAEGSSAKEVERAVSDGRAKAIVISSESSALIDSISLKAMKAIFVAGELDEEVIERNFWREVYAESSDFAIAETRCDTPAFIFDGFVYGHSLLIGSLPAFEMVNDFDLAGDAIFYTPMKWSLAESLFGLLYPAWFYGLAVVACEKGDALAIAERYRVTNLLVSSEVEQARSLRVSPTSMLSEDKRQAGSLFYVDEDARKRRDLHLRSVYSINQSPPRWAKECGASSASALCVRGAPMVLASCERWPSTLSCGRAAPGHRVEVIDESGRILPPGKAGFIAVRRPDPSLFLSRCGEAGGADEWFRLAGGLKGEDGSLQIAPDDR